MKYRKWLVFIGIIALTFFGVSCGEKRETTALSSPTSDFAAASESSAESSVQTSSSTLTTDEGVAGLPIDKSEFVMNLFEGKVLGIKGGSGLVYDLEVVEYEGVQKLFDDAELPIDIKNDFVYPQVAFDSEDGKKFNDNIRNDAQAFIENMSSSFIETLTAMREDIEKNGYLRITYGVIEGEKYLSIILVDAYTYKDYKSPEYFFNCYVFEKETGRMISPVELIQMAFEDNRELAYEGVAKLFRSLVVEEVSNEDSNFEFDRFLYRLWYQVQGEANAFGSEISDIGNISNLCIYMDENDEPKVLFACNDYFYGLVYDMEGHHKISREKLEKYTWYNEKVVDVPLRELIPQHPEEDRLYQSAREHFGIADTPDVLVAYIGGADDYTVRTFQRFVDLFEIDYYICDMLIHRNTGSEDYSPRSVYLVIPRYRNALVETMHIYGSGFSVVSVDQNERDRMPITIRYGEKTLIIHQPVDYRIGEDRIEQDGVYDFTDQLVPFDDPTVELRPEVEEYFDPIRTRG